MKECVLAPLLFNICKDWLFEKVVDRICFEASVCNIMVTYLDFTDDAGLLAISLEILALTLGSRARGGKASGINAFLYQN